MHLTPSDGFVLPVGAVRIIVVSPRLSAAFEQGVLETADSVVGTVSALNTAFFRRILPLSGHRFGAEVRQFAVAGHRGCERERECVGVCVHICAYYLQSGNVGDLVFALKNAGAAQMVLVPQPDGDLCGRSSPRGAARPPDISQSGRQGENLRTHQLQKAVGQWLPEQM